MDLIFPACITAIAGITLYLCIQRAVPWTLCLLLLPPIFLFEFVLERSIQQDHAKELSGNVARQVNSITTKLTGEINSITSLTLGLVAYISLQPDITREEFSEFSRELTKNNPLLVGVAGAPDLVIRMIYPTEGNEAALGLDYRKNDQQRASVLQSKESGNLVLAGPVKLVQGGMAFILRAPVYIGDSKGSNKFWGVVSAPIDTNMLYQAIGLQDDSLTINIAIRGRDGLGSEGDTFYGDNTLFDDANNIQTTIPICSGFWQIAAHPSSGWHQTPNSVWVSRGTAIVLAIACLLILFSRHRQALNNRQYEIRIRENEQLLQDAGRLALIGGWKLHVNGELSHLSEQSARIFGFAKNNDHNLEDILALFSESQALQLKYHFQEAITSGRKFDTELQINHGDNTRWVRLIGNPVHHHGHITEIVGAVQDITEKKKFVEMIQRQATYDTVTGLPNRFLFENRLSKLLPQAQREECSLAILFIDLDNFKSVNDNLGHKAGDLLLTEVAHRIKSCTRTSDTVARYSGDEFTVILHNIRNTSDAYTIAANILKRINRPFEILSHQLFCSASIGIANYPENGSSAEELVTNADQAMYEVKKSGRNGCLYFTQEMQRLSESRHQMHNKLSSAIADETLEVHLQPLVPLDSGLTLKCEALVRWFDNGTPVPPIEFITLAEETGMINAIDRLVLKKASHYLQDIKKQTGVLPCLSVNVSPRVFSTRDNSLKLWLDLVTGLAGKFNITVEITERLLTQNTDRALEVLKTLKAAGVAIAIDDFGTGYSSLSYLTTFPIDVIKIDRAFVGNIENDHSAATLTDTIISLARKLSLQVVAEGVETGQQLEFLKERGCHYVQGYYLGKPMGKEDFSQWLTEYRSNSETTFA